MTCCDLRAFDVHLTCKGARQVHACTRPARQKIGARGRADVLVDQRIMYVEITRLFHEAHKVGYHTVIWFKVWYIKTPERTWDYIETSHEHLLRPLRL